MLQTNDFCASALPESGLIVKKSSTLSPVKQALLEQRLKGASSGRTTTPEIPARPDRDSAPLSFSQRQMWVIDQITPGNPAYNLPNGYRLRGPLDVTALERSFNEIIKRHEALRTTFVVEGGEPLQRIRPELKIAINVAALGHLSREEREDRLQALASEESVRPFDLSRLPLIRVCVFKLGDAEHVLIINLHHIVADGLSIGLLLDELDAFYRAFTGGGYPHPAELAVQYADFAQWQRHTLANEAAYAKQIEYWRTQLRGRLPVLELPGDMPRPVLQSFKGSNVFFDIPAALAQELRVLGAREGCTFFMTVLAAFQVLLQRYSGAEDIVIGTPVAARTLREVEPLIGNFLNMAALRCDVSGNPTFIELLRRSRDTTLDAFTNSDLPFEAMMQRLKFERDPSRNPIFQVVLQVLSSTAPRIGDLQISSFHFDLKFAQFDLSLHLYEEAGGYMGRIEYCTDLFRRDTVQRLSTNFEQLLHAIVSNPRQTISKIPILAASERNQVVNEWNDTAREYGAEARLHGLVEAQAARTPDRVALEFEGREITYAQLNARANQLARVLRARGVGPEVLVGVFAERSFEMVLSLLSVLKAGGTYVPLDPSYPEERLCHMLEDAHARLVLAQPHLASRLPADAGPVMLLDASWAAYAGEAGENLDDVGTPEDLAYVIFTSGSTGRPKGAMNTHRGICNRLLWMQEEYGLGGDDRVLQKTPFSFDVSVWEFFWPLLTGARLVIALPEGHKDSGYLVRLIRQSGITTLHFVPSMLRVFLEEEGLEACRSLKRVICSGEALPHELQERFFARLPGVDLHNLYGPTEAAVDVTYWACRPGDERLIVPIGRPVANTQIYVLDGWLEPVPVGVPGELYIGGVQVGRGYVGRPDLTADRFVPDPFSNTPGARVYRTGDLVRHLPDGAIEYLGRLDYQVKIRGQRVELGEIEAGIGRHPAIRDVVVLAREDAPGDKRLVAYLIADSPPADLEDQLRALIRTTMPEYMLPAHFVTLDALPLTHNGKLDRKALPAPDMSDVALRAGAVAPRTPTEETVMAAFRGVLERADFGVLDNFFDLGGHSLMATRLMYGLRAATDVDLPLRNLFERPTVAGLAAAIEGLSWMSKPNAVTQGAGDREEIEI